MSSNKPSRYQLTQWINCCVGCHDLICHCDQPIQHLIKTIFDKKEPLYVTKKKRKILKNALLLPKKKIQTSLEKTDLDLET